MGLIPARSRAFSLLYLISSGSLIRSLMEVQQALDARIEQFEQNGHMRL